MMNQSLNQKALTLLPKFSSELEAKLYFSSEMERIESEFKLPPEELTLLAETQPNNTRLQLYLRCDRALALLNR